LVPRLLPYMGENRAKQWCVLLTDSWVPARIKLG
jgi:hypothetical protein